MKNILSELKPAHRRKAKRLGQGKASGKGGTSTKGHKGQKARSGVRLKRGFEGGQMPLARRLPKFGFSNENFKTRYEIVNLDRLNQLDGAAGPEEMIQKKWVKKGRLIKILGAGKLKKPLKISAHAFTKGAKLAIEEAKGQAIVLGKK